MSLRARDQLAISLYPLARSWSKVAFVLIVGDCRPMSGSFVHSIKLAGCRRFTGPLPSGPSQRGTPCLTRTNASRRMTAMHAV
jgi:hypothetical protein